VYGYRASYFLIDITVEWYCGNYYTHGDVDDTEHKFWIAPSPELFNVPDIALGKMRVYKFPNQRIPVLAYFEEYAGRTWMLTLAYAESDEDNTRNPTLAGNYMPTHPLDYRSVYASRYGLTKEYFAATRWYCDKSTHNRVFHVTWTDPDVS
jgi:hypothetical protein